MSFFQNKPAGTPSAFGTPQPQNNTSNAFSAFSTPQAPKPGPFSVAGLGGGQQSQQSTPSAFMSAANTGGGWLGGNTNQSTGAFGQNTQQQGGIFGQNTSQQGNASGQNTLSGGFGQNTGGFGQSTGGFGQNTGTGTGFGGFGQQPGGFGGGFLGQQNQQQQQPNQTAFGGGFLGQQQQQPQQQSAFGGSPFGGGLGGGSAFTGNTSLSGSTLGGGSTGGWFQPQQPQQQPQQYQQQSQITPITRWSDLPPSDQKFLEDLEKYITEQKAICEDLKTRSPQLEEYVSSIPTDVAEVQKRFDTISHILAVDTTLLNNDLKQKFDLLSSQTQQAIRLLEVLIHPSASSLSYLASTHGAGGDSLIDLFLKKTVEWQGKLDSFKREIAEIDRMLKAVEEGQMGGASSASEEIMETIRAQWDGFCGLAARVGKLKERAAEVKIAVERGLRGGRL